MRRSLRSVSRAMAHHLHRPWQAATTAMTWSDVRTKAIAVAALHGVGAQGASNETAPKARHACQDEARSGAHMPQRPAPPSVVVHWMGA